MMDRLVIGILAHVDAGKTTLSEAMLYESGSIRKLGRVDNKDAYLDTYELERTRGITIFSKQAVFTCKEKYITLLDTPGHVDFSAEMERTLQVLDYAILVISGADGVQSHTKTLWRLLEKYQIPVFLFINKMDQRGTSKERILEELQNRLSDGCIDFSDTSAEEFFEAAAMGDEEALNEFLSNGAVEKDTVKRLIEERKLFPCFFGSALKVLGVREFMEVMAEYTAVKTHNPAFGARVFKIARDGQGNRLTYMKVTGGSLKVKSVLPECGEKINQIRIYSGEKYETLNEAEEGCICAVTGLVNTFPGQGFGCEAGQVLPLLAPVLTCQMLLPKGLDASLMMPKLRQIAEEMPELHIVYKEALAEIQVQIMGQIQTEILKSMIEDRFAIKVEFGPGSILYKETIADTVEGVGHFEPLRHYAEVHLLLEPLERGKGLVFETDCSEDLLDKNWQRLILTHLQEKEHKGVLTGAPITDMKITLKAGRAHKKHTEGGDFRQATYRAVRQGLKKARSVLLEPYYAFRLEIPETMTGRAMTDIEKMKGSFDTPQIAEGIAVLTGSAPVSLMQNYQTEVTAYTKGAGKLFLSLKGYEVCHNEEEVIANALYDAELDMDNPCGSVFCSHGAGFLVPWNEVEEYMHLESCLDKKSSKLPESCSVQEMKAQASEEWIDTEEVDAILARTYDSNKKDKSVSKWGNAGKKKPVTAGPIVRNYKKPPTGEEYLLVDGYNVIYAWENLKELADTNIDGARGKLLDILCDYQGIKKCNLIVVFDAYRVQGHAEEILDYHNIHVVYTKEAETADQYIEKFAHEHGRKYRVTVATSDGLEQIIIRGQGCQLLSARELQKEIITLKETLRQQYLDTPTKGTQRLFDTLPSEVAEQIENMRIMK